MNYSKEQLWERFQKYYAEFPEIGSPRTASDPSLAGLRLWPVPGFEKFRICYIPRVDHIDVLRVLHGARDSERFFE